ncbi:MAG TPA: HlyD family efflux transporter periplasmic adaptor subunit [Caldilineae bacterium]|nr:HlyD family efflux transporter periplasmic adaptor subunit [Caldilineae bacterium]
MKSKPHPLLVLLLIVIIAGAVGYWYFSNNPEEWQQVLVDFGLNEIELFQPPEAKAELPLTASGFVEAHEVTVASEVGGRIERLSVEKGDEVAAGQPVIRLDTALLDAQKEQIEAQIALAEAQLAQVRAGTPAEAIAVAETGVTVAEAQRDAAEQAWQDAILLRDTPQQLDAQIDAAKSKVEIAWLQMKQAEYLRDAADLGEDIAKKMWDITRQYPIGDDYQAAANWNLASMSVWQGYISWENAKATYTAALNERDTLMALRDDPIQAQLLVTQAEADYQAQVAAVEVAKANLEQLQAPVPQAQIGVLEANLEQAHTQLATLAAQLEKFTLVSPLDGVVVQKIAHEGEIAIPGTALLTVSDLDEVTLTVYVSEADYGRLRQGQAVDVQVDSYPGETFTGVITRISDEAEFTPKNVQTQDERVSLVYAIEITIPNASHQLKPGVPADVVFVEAIPR